jgi:hypothetical protein
MTRSRFCPAKGLAGLRWLKLGGQPVHDVDCLDAYAENLADEVDHVVGVIVAITHSRAKRLPKRG